MSTGQKSTVREVVEQVKQISLMGLNIEEYAQVAFSVLSEHQGSKMAKEIFRAGTSEILRVIGFQEDPVKSVRDQNQKEFEFAMGQLNNFDMVGGRGESVENVRYDAFNIWNETSEDMISSELTEVYGKEVYLEA